LLGRAAEAKVRASFSFETGIRDLVERFDRVARETALRP
jgi:hypothetical protein